MEELDGDKLVGDVGVVDGHGVADHGERVDDVGLAVTAGLTGVVLLHVAKCA